MQLTSPSSLPTATVRWRPGALAAASRHLSIALFLGLILLSLAVLVVSDRFAVQELTWTIALRQWGGQWLRPWMLGAHRFHDSLIAMAALLLIGLPAWHRQWRATGETALVLFGGMALNFVLKAAFHRPRPVIEQLVGAHGYAFPSGHVLSAAIVAGWAACMIFRSVDNARLRWMVVVLATLAVGFVATSRVYLGVHYPSDTVASCIVAACWIHVCLAVTEHRR